MHPTPNPLGLRAVSAAARALSISLLATSLLSGCWFDSSDDSGTTNSGGTVTPPGATGASIAGTVIKGPVSGSTVTAYPLNADGTLGTAIGSGTTSATGAFTLTLTGTPTGAVVLVASGGSYVSEADGSTVAKTSDLLAIVPSVGTGVTGLVITPLSDMLAARARAIGAAHQRLGCGKRGRQRRTRSDHGTRASCQHV